MVNSSSSLARCTLVGGRFIWQPLWYRNDQEHNLTFQVCLGQNTFDYIEIVMPHEIYAQCPLHTWRVCYKGSTSGKRLYKNLRSQHLQKHYVALERSKVVRVFGLPM